MKDMFVRAAAKVDHDLDAIRALRLVCFHQTCKSHQAVSVDTITHWLDKVFRMHITFMDNPQGYVCRVIKSKEYEIPRQASLIPSQLLPMLKLTLQAKVTYRYTESKDKTHQQYVNRQIVQDSIQLLETQRVNFPVTAG